ncbi:hypothetical protein ANN_06386 [Periplaneta americana]|uniref:Tc1-like transposase DDE domain-containing protein n=1 Tax=Periplaneta americana TaxID=6978 RepID=A0ABQ8TFF7_PERAM|nr:hypothetical protein ANN_06386 [Periplaneta americana]
MLRDVCGTRAHLGQKAWVDIKARLEKPKYYGRNDHDFKIKCRKQKTDVVKRGYDGWINFENETQDRQEWRNAICEREGKDSGFFYDLLDGARTTFRVACLPEVSSPRFQQVHGYGWVLAENPEVDNVLKTLEYCIQMYKKRLGLLTNAIILHDNATVHTADVKTRLRRWRWEVLDHLSYSPDLSPCYFDLIPKLKAPLRGRCFPTQEDIANAVRREITSCLGDYFEGKKDNSSCRKLHYCAAEEAGTAEFVKSEPAVFSLISVSSGRSVSSSGAKSSSTNTLWLYGQIAEPLIGRFYFFKCFLHVFFRPFGLLRLPLEKLKHLKTHYDLFK